MKNTFGRKLYSPREFYRISYLAFLSISDFIAMKKNKSSTKEFIERIMLAVTQVNGCEVNSFAHTKMALETGMSNEEIQNMLAGVIDYLPREEISTLMFTQHYADTRKNPSKETWERILDIYGLDKAKGVLATTRIIMMRNASGIPWTSCINRCKGKADSRSSLVYEVTIIMATAYFFSFLLSILF